MTSKYTRSVFFFPQHHQKTKQKRRKKKKTARSVVCCFFFFSYCPFFFLVLKQKKEAMKLLGKQLDKNNSGRIKLLPQEPEDLWHAFNIIVVGDRVVTKTIR